MSNNRFIKIKPISYSYIYKPAEDSLLIIDFIKRHPKLFYNKDVLDMGTGSGILGIEAADSGSNVTAVDINNFVVEEAKEKLSSKHKQKINFKTSDLFSNVRKKFDIILFNPPYLPTKKNEDKSIALTVSGGKHGYEIIREFFSKANRHLKKEGFILLVFSSLTHKSKVDEIILHYGFKSQLLGKRNFDFERIFLYKVEKRNFLRVKGLNNVCLFAKGKRGIVYRANLRLSKNMKADVAVKVLRQDTKAENVIDKEEKWLLFLNSYGIGPKFILKRNNFLIMEFVSGIKILDYIRKINPKKSFSIIKELLKQCVLLDLLQIDKEELHHPLKHIIIRKEKPIMIDFERVHFSRKPKNTTQFIQFLSSGYVKTALKNKSTLNTACLRNLSKRYKTELARYLIELNKTKSNSHQNSSRFLLNKLNKLLCFLISGVNECLSIKNKVNKNTKNTESNFRLKVYDLVKRIPKGRVSTYKIIAEKISSKAYRAVGNALNKNPYMEVPCHRVVKSNGEVGGFARGTKEKIRILKKEGLNINKDKIKNFERVLYKF